MCVINKQTLMLLPIHPVTRDGDQIAQSHSTTVLVSTNTSTNTAQLQQTIGSLRSVMSSSSGPDALGALPSECEYF